MGGKSTCCGHLYAKCGMIDDHNLEKIQSGTVERQKWSNIMDITEEEQIKGKTHDFNIVELKIQSKDGGKEKIYNMIDTPGHKTFVRSLIEGISQEASSSIIACLLISMAKGEFEAGWHNGQTKEDVLIARACGIEHLIVLVNKMDLIDWNESKYQEVCNVIGPFLKKCRFKTITYIPVSGYYGIGLVDTKDMPSWYSGSCLLDKIDSIELSPVVEVPLSLDKFTSMIMDVQILAESPFLMAPGFQCVMHYAGKEYEVQLNKIIGKKKYLESGDIAKVVFNLMNESSSNPIIRAETRRFILRTDRTIGFGKIDKVKL